VTEIIHQLGPVFDEAQIVAEASVGEGLPGHQTVVPIVVGHEYRDGFAL